MFDFELDRASAWISGRGYSSVALQLPEGLKVRAAEISSELSSSTGAEIIIIGRPCYGACDLFDYRGTADALIHFGHSPIPSQGEDPDVLYIEARSDACIDGSVMEKLAFLPGKVGLLATVQYLGLIPRMKEILEGSGRKVFVGTGDRRICHPGQVLGCNCTAAEAVSQDADAFLFIGEGDFHPLAAAFGMRQQVCVLNPVTGEVRDMAEARDRILRKRFAAIQRAAQAQTFLVIVCSKKGQNRPEEASRITEMLRSHGKTAFKVVMEEVTPMSLMAYRADAYVSTACPRIAMDDSARYERPMLTVPEAEVLLGERSWDGYEFDQIRAAQTV